MPRDTFLTRLDTCNRVICAPMPVGWLRVGPSSLLTWFGWESRNEHGRHQPVHFDARDIYSRRGRIADSPDPAARSRYQAVCPRYFHAGVYCLAASAGAFAPRVRRLRI